MAEHSPSSSPNSESPPKEVRDILSKDDVWNWDSIYVEVDRSYVGRIIGHAWKEFKRHKKSETIGGVTVPPIVALITGTITGSITAGLWAGFLTLIGILFVVFLSYLITAPKEMDEALRGDLSAARNQVLEEKRKIASVVAIFSQRAVTHPVLTGVAPSREIGTVSCFITEERGRVEGARVVIENEETGRKYSGASDRNGGLQLRVPHGVYTVRASAPGYLDLVEAANVEDDYCHVTLKLEALRETKRKRDTKNIQDLVDGLAEFSKRGGELLRRAHRMPDENALQPDLGVWENEATEYIKSRMGRGQEMLFVSESPLEIYHIAAATSAHRNILNRINTKVVRLNRLIEQLNQNLQMLWEDNETENGDESR